MTAFTMLVPLNDVNHAIQLALAPVFLLTGIAGLLNVMTGRLARIIDRGRQIVEGQQLDSDTRRAIELELQNLERRRHLASLSINACTLAALLVCVVITALFAEALFEVPLKGLAGILFIASTLALVVGLSCFLREVHLAGKTVRILVTLPKLTNPAPDSQSNQP